MLLVTRLLLSKKISQVVKSMGQRVATAEVSKNVHLFGTVSSSFITYTLVRQTGNSAVLAADKVSQEIYRILKEDRISS